MWSSPIRFFIYEETVESDVTYINVGQDIDSIGAVFIGKVIQSTDSYSFGATGVVTFDFTIPAGVKVQIWVGRYQDLIVQELIEYKELFEEYKTSIETSESNAATSATEAATLLSNLTETVWTETPTEATTEFTPTDITFTTAKLFVGSLFQHEGESYTITDNTITFTEAVPAGVKVYAYLRNEV